MIGLDLGGVLANTAASLNRLVLERLGVEAGGVALTPVSEYLEPEGAFPAELRQAAGALAQALYQDAEGAVYREAPPMAGAVEAVNWLHRRGLLAGYVSHRPAHTEAVTRAWLSRYGFPQSRLRLVSGPKAPALKLMRATVMVEDNPAEAQALYQDGVRVILYDQPYNRALACPHLRMSGWDALHEFLTRLPLDYRAKREKGF